MPKATQRLLALLGDGADRAFVEREVGSDALARNLYIGLFALDADPPAAEAPRHCARRAGTEKRIEHDIARLGARAGRDTAGPRVFGRMRLVPALVLDPLAPLQIGKSQSLRI